MNPYPVIPMQPSFVMSNPYSLDNRGAAISMPPRQQLFYVHTDGAAVPYFVPQVQPIPLANQMYGGNLMQSQYPIGSSTSPDQHSLYHPSTPPNPSTQPFNNSYQPNLSHWPNPSRTAPQSSIQLPAQHHQPARQESRSQAVEFNLKGDDDTKDEQSAKSKEAIEAENRMRTLFCSKIKEVTQEPSSLSIASSLSSASSTTLKESTTSGSMNGATTPVTTIAQPIMVTTANKQLSENLAIIPKLSGCEPVENICPGCQMPYGKNEKRKIVDSCDHARCYSCLAGIPVCPVCTTAYSESTNGEPKTKTENLRDVTQKKSDKLALQTSSTTAPNSYAAIIDPDAPISRKEVEKLILKNIAGLQKQVSELTVELENLKREQKKASEFAAYFIIGEYAKLVQSKLKVPENVSSFKDACGFGPSEFDEVMRDMDYFIGERNRRVHEGDQNPRFADELLSNCLYNLPKESQHIFDMLGR